MDDLDQYLKTECLDTWVKAKHLSDVESGNDPESEPYKSKYAARELIKRLVESLLDKLADHNIVLSECSNPRVLSVVSCLYEFLGNNYMSCEETSEGETYLDMARDLLKPHRHSVFAVHVYMSVLNNLAILSSNRDNDEQAYEHLVEADRVYVEYEKECSMIPHDAISLLSTRSSSMLDNTQREGFEMTRTLTLFYLAQVYKKLGDNDKSGEYCELTLGRQLTSGQYNPVEWSENAATLSQYYIGGSTMLSGDGQQQQQQARNLEKARRILAAAQFISSTIPDDEENEDNERKIELKAYISRCWGKYAEILLRESADTFDSDSDDQSNGVDVSPDQPPSNTGEVAGQSASSTGEAVNESASSNLQHVQTSTSQNEDDTEPLERRQCELCFPTLELTHLEDQFPGRLVRTFDAARQVFVAGFRHLTLSKLFYTLQTHASDHVEIVQQVSQLYAALSRFEPDTDRQCKMHKRRLDALTYVLGELNPQHYLQYCRQLTYEMGETYVFMVQLKLRRLNPDTGADDPSLNTSNADATTAAAGYQHTVKKINTLVQAGIRRFTEFVDTFKSGGGAGGGVASLPETLADDTWYNVLMAFLHIGKLYPKLIVTTGGTDDGVSVMEEELGNVERSKECFEYVLSYCERHEAQTGERFSLQYDVCREMVALQDIKIGQLRQQQHGMHNH